MGIKDNNPGNLRISSQPWQGKLPQASRQEFEAFDTPEHGLRAMAKLLLTYFKEGARNIEDIIAKWAPPEENNTDAYIDAVSDQTGFDSDAVLTPDAGTLAKLVAAITTHENGRNPYNAELINSAVNDALT